MKIISVVDQYGIGKCSIMSKRIFGFPNFFMLEMPKSDEKYGKVEGQKKPSAPTCPQFLMKSPIHIMKNVSENQIILTPFLISAIFCISKILAPKCLFTLKCLKETPLYCLKWPGFHNFYEKMLLPMYKNLF